MAQQGLSQWLNGCDPTTEGIVANLLGGALAGPLLSRLPLPQKYVSDLWKEAWKGQNAWVNRAHHVKDAVDSLEYIPVNGAVNVSVDALKDWLWNE